MKAFIFSLDSFVAFTLALVAIYTLIFFSAIPSSYYYLLTQGQYLTKDTLYSLSTSDCVSPQFSCDLSHSSLLDNIVFGTNSETNVYDSIGKVVPSQFGYTLEYSQDNGQTWIPLYDTSSAALSVAGDPHARTKLKMSVSSQVVVFQNPNDLADKNAPDPFTYETCNGGQVGPVLTCASSPSNAPAGVGGAGVYVPSPSFRLVRLTIFI
jgi:hypothetical protein